MMLTQVSTVISVINAPAKMAQNFAKFSNNFKFVSSEKKP
jgi:hypothetical protein